MMAEGLHPAEDTEENARARMKALSEATRIGIADIEHGRYWSFDSAADRGRHLGIVRDRAVSK